MKKIDLGQTITIFANVGVILGIVLLAYELHQNNELLESQANLILLQNRLRGTELLVSDDSLGEAVLRDRNGEDLSELDLLKLDNFLLGTLSKWEWEYRQNFSGLIADENLPVNDWRAVFSSFPEMGKLWSDEAFTIRFASDFVQFMDENIVSR